MDRPRLMRLQHAAWLPVSALICATTLCFWHVLLQPTTAWVGDACSIDFQGTLQQLWLSRFHHYDLGELSHTVYLNYPTGSDTAPSSTSGGTAPDTAVFRVAQDFPGDPFEPADIDFAGGLSPYGTMAQGGNVDEVLEIGPGPAVLRGGSYGNGGPAFLLNDSRRALSSLFSANAGTGFRVAMIGIPEPGTLALLAICAMGTLVRGKRHN